MAHADDRVMIVGGGIGGLSAAAALERRGVPTVVFERAPELAEVGAGIQVWLNGMVALRELGLDERVLDEGSPVEVQSMRSSTGLPLIRIPVGELARRHGAPTAVICRRPELLRALGDAVGDGVVQLSSNCVGYEQDAEGVTARFEDGREERGSALVIADGLRSTLSRQIAPERVPRYGGYQFLRSLTPGGADTVEPGHMTITFGPSDFIGMSDVGGGLRYFFASVTVPEGTADSPQGRKHDLLRHFGHFPAPVPAVLEETPEDWILRNDISDIAPLARWTEGRVTLLGDAAHATTPNGGRGASESLEDAVTVGRFVGEAWSSGGPSAVPQALASYEATRRGPTARVQLGARKIGRVTSWRNPVVCRVRDQVMKRITSKKMLQEIEDDYARMAAEGFPVA